MIIWRQVEVVELQLRDQIQQSREVPCASQWTTTVLKLDPRHL